MNESLRAPASIVVSVRVETEVAGYLIRRYPNIPLSSIISQTLSGFFKDKPLPSRLEAFEWIKQSGTGFSRSKALTDIRKEATSLGNAEYLLDMLDNAPPSDVTDFSSLTALSDAFKEADKSLE